MIGLAIHGMGRAGQARARALEGHPSARCVATVSRRQGGDLGAVLARDDVQGIIVCTENSDHPTAIRAALNAGKHVAVEFPLAPDGQTCRELFALAAAQDRVLHTELIGQLTGGFQSLRTASDQATGVDCSFSGGLYRWVADEAAAGHHAVLATARLHAAWALAGPLTLDAVNLQDDGPEGYILDVRAHGRIPVRIVEERRPGTRRSSSITLRGDPVLPTPPPTPPLFRADLDVFLERIRGGSGYVDDATVIAVADLADRIDRRC